MKFSIALIVATAATVFARAAPAPGACFDDGDCLIFSGGGSCQNFNCVGSPGATTTASAPAASGSSQPCFDDGDCLIFWGGGHCQSFSCVH